MALKELQFQRDVEIDRIYSGMRFAQKKSLYTHIAEDLAAQCKTNTENVMDHIMVQEERSPVSIGNGVAILAVQLASLQPAFTTLWRLNNTLDFTALDSQQVDLICVIYSPLSDGPQHLRRISRITRLFKNVELVEKIRATHDDETAQALIHNPDGWMLAA